MGRKPLKMGFLWIFWAFWKVPTPKGDPKGGFWALATHNFGLVTLFTLEHWKFIMVMGFWNDI